MVNKYLNNILVQTSKILGCEVGIIEGNGTVVSASGINEISMNVADVIDAYQASKSKLLQVGGYTFYAVISRGRVEYITFIKNDDPLMGKQAELLSSYIGTLRQLHNDKYDKTNYERRIIFISKVRNSD